MFFHGGLLLRSGCTLALFVASLGTLAGTAANAQSSMPAPIARQIAVTVDDLPAMSAGQMSAADITELNRKLLATLREQKIPAVGFVIEGSLYAKPGDVDARIDVLRSWADAGFELGNHTWSHVSLNQMNLDDWKVEIVQGEVVTRLILAEHKMTPRYFRHPFLDAGPDLMTRRKSEAYLSERGYRVAPVTIDTFDWFFADIYQDARDRHDTALQQRTVEAWLSYDDAIFAYEEQRCRDLLGYEPKQVLLVHDSWLEAEHMGELLALMRRRGYQYISLPDALTDPAYAQPDDYVSDVGASWIDHWAVTRGRIRAGGTKPSLPEWAQKKHQQLDSAETN